MWAPPHKDTGLFTVLLPAAYFDAQGARLPSCPDAEVGLYVRDRRGAIARIAGPPGAGECLFFQLGEAMQAAASAHAATTRRRGRHLHLY